MPIGAPGWPELACCTASIASARIALAIIGVSGRRGGHARRSGRCRGIRGAVKSGPVERHDFSGGPAARRAAGAARGSSACARLQLIWLKAHPAARATLEHRKPGTAMRHLTLDVIHDEHQALARRCCARCACCWPQHRREGTLPDFERAARDAVLRRRVSRAAAPPEGNASCCSRSCASAAPSCRRCSTGWTATTRAAKRAIRDLEHALLAFEVLGEPRRAGLRAGGASATSTSTSTHMALEEDEILPLAAQAPDRQPTGPSSTPPSPPTATRSPATSRRPLPAAVPQDPDAGAGADRARAGAIALR